MLWRFIGLFELICFDQGNSQSQNCWMQSDLGPVVQSVVNCSSGFNTQYSDIFC